MVFRCRLRHHDSAFAATIASSKHQSFEVVAEHPGAVCLPALSAGISRKSSKAALPCHAYFIYSDTSREDPLIKSFSSANHLHQSINRRLQKQTGGESLNAAKR
jgi:hypothetical protein